MAATREGVKAVMDRYGDEIRRQVDEAPPLSDAAVALLRAAGYPLRTERDEQGAA